MKLRIACFAAAALPVLAQTPLLVDTAWLSAHLNDRDLVVLHVGPPADYAQKHIPGSRQISMDAVIRPMQHNQGDSEIMVELADVATLRKNLEAVGISDDSRIVLYFGSFNSQLGATRILFTLDYLGLGDRASILDGGLTGWTSAGKPTATDATSPKPGHLSVRPTKNVVAEAPLVKDIGQHNGYKLVDARDAQFYNGSSPTYNKNGHIPGAVNIPFSEIFDRNLNFRKARAEELFGAAGIKPGETIVAYCHIGMQATVVMLAARTLGHPVMLYDGSFQDWAVNNRGPVVK